MSNMNRRREVVVIIRETVLGMVQDAMEMTGTSEGAMLGVLSLECSRFVGDFGHDYPAR